MPKILLQKRVHRKFQLQRAKFTSFLVLFILGLFVGSISAGTQAVWTGVEKIVAVGDIHGDYDNFVKILKGTQVVDCDLRWAGGATHLVQIGDIMDRGFNAKKIFDLLIRLEQEAKEAGGMLHVLLGNHEELNITGLVFRYPDYLTVNQFKDFLPDGFKKKQEGRLQKMIKDIGDDAQRQALSDKFWNKLISDPWAQREYTTNLYETYGSWILGHNAVIKINDIVFVHGGISEKYSTWKIEKINDLLRQELSDLAQKAVRSEPQESRLSIAYQADGPLWYRELATVPEEDLKEEVDVILSNLGAKVLVIAHTPRVPTRQEMERFGGKVWIVDTGISFAYGGRLSALIINNGIFKVWGEKNEQADPSSNPPHDSPRLGPFIL